MKFFDEVYSLNGHVYEVGGTVRDRLMGKTDYKDRDLIVTGIPITDLTKILKKNGDVITVGKSFGVIKFYPRDTTFGAEFDIALPRKEVSTGVGHRDFEVDFDPHLPVEIDLSRRDFTINAMARELRAEKLIDPFQGATDLSQKILRMVSKNAFTEDPLRMLRGIQFAARFGLTIDPETFDSIKKNAELIKTVSPERITEELKKLFSAEKPSVGFILMRDTQLLDKIFPEVFENVGVEQGNKLHKDDVFLHTLRVLDASRKDAAIPFAGDMELMLAALFHDVGKARTKRYDKEKERMTFYGHQSLSRKMAKVRMATLKMTTLGINPKNVMNLVEHHMFQTKSFFSDRAIRRFINKVGPDLILKLVDLRIADNRGGKYPEGIKGVLRLRKKIETELANKPALTAKDLLIGGNDLMSLGIPEGPTIGQIIKQLITFVIDQPDLNTPERLLLIAKNIFEKPDQPPIPPEWVQPEILEDLDADDSDTVVKEADTCDDCDSSQPSSTDRAAGEFIQEVWTEMKNQESQNPLIGFLHERLDHSVFLVGLTGGIASGKSSAASAIKEIGIPVIDADQVAREIVEVGTDAYEEIIKNFGPEILSADKTLDRKKIAKIVFENPEKKSLLESIIHPAVFRKMLSQVQTLKKDHPLIVLEVPLLFESGLHEQMDRNILIKVDPETQKNRLMNRDGISLEDAMARIQNQMSTEEKEKFADYIIDNTGPLEETQKAVSEILFSLKNAKD